MMANGLYEQALDLLRRMTANPAANFHQHQFEAINGLVLQRQKMLVVQRTGWGKSAVYFIATALLRAQGRGPTIIISPLIALMRNQIQSAAKLGLTVVTVNSSLTQQQRQSNEQLIISGAADAIIISPEQLANQRFITGVLNSVLSNIGLFVVDEAHCISDWGHDFRPDYRRITRIMQSMPDNMPVLATTATANDRVVSDIEAQLGGNIAVLRGALLRESLSLQTVPLWSRAKRLVWLSTIIPRLNGAGIVYAKTIRDCETVTNWLRYKGINAHTYHSDIDSQTRIKLEDDLIRNKIKVLVATSALGMGFDKPDIGFVIHYQAPGNIIEYYQQVGRAGRGIASAVGVLMLGEEDQKIQNYFITNAFPSEQQVQEVLNLLEASEDGLTKSDIERLSNLSSSTIEKVLKFLAVEDPAPIYKNGSVYSRTAVSYQLPVDRIERLSSIKTGEWRQLLAYHQSQACLMRFLASELDDKLAADCGRCQNCNPASRLDLALAESEITLAERFARQQYVPIKPRKQIGRGTFETYKFPLTDPTLMAEPGLALSRWLDGGWGDLVAQGKQNNVFSDELIEPMFRMICSMEMVKAPTWLCYVPSIRHPTLVRDFAHKLAARLNVYCADTVSMTKLRKPQKTRQNTSRRCENLDGLFEVDPMQVYSGNVLLLDDSVDSGWTFTVVAALLKRFGAERVYPIALTSTSNV